MKEDDLKISELFKSFLIIDNFIGKLKKSKSSAVEKKAWSVVYYDVEAIVYTLLKLLPHHHYHFFILFILLPSFI